MKQCSGLILSVSLSGMLAAFTACGGVPDTEQGASGTVPEQQSDQGGGTNNDDTLGAVELGTVEQAIGEATCGTGTPDRTISFSGSFVDVFINAPYNNASCSQASLNGFRSTKAKATVDTFIQVKAANKAECDAASFKSFFFSRGSLVTSSNGVHAFTGSCTVGATYVFDPTQTGIRVLANGNIVIGAAAPVAADNARFALQGLNGAKVQQKLTFTAF
jgi:hypothetical protein